MGATGWGSESPWPARDAHREGAHRLERAGSLRAADAAANRSLSVYEEVHAAPEFVELRRRLRRFAFPMTAAFLVWYLAFVLLACYARDLMAVPVADGINLGLVIGLLQFVSTFAISTVYVVFARRRLDPLAERLKERIERERAAHEPAAHGQVDDDPVPHEPVSDDTDPTPSVGCLFDDDARGAR